MTLVHLPALSFLHTDSLILSSNSVLCSRSHPLFFFFILRLSVPHFHSFSCFIFILSSLTDVHMALNQTCISTQQLSVGPSPMYRFSSSRLVVHESTHKHANLHLCEGEKKQYNVEIVKSLWILNQTWTNQTVYACEIRFSKGILSEEFFSTNLLDIKQLNSVFQSPVVLKDLFCSLVAKFNTSFKQTDNIILLPVVYWNSAQLCTVCITLFRLCLIFVSLYCTSLILDICVCVCLCVSTII